VALAKRNKGRCHARPATSLSTSVPQSTVAATSSRVVPVPSDTPKPPPASPKPSPTHTTQESKPSPPVENPAPAPPKPSSTGSSSTTSSADVAAYLGPQNSLRAKKGAVAFTWNDTLATYAKRVANTCVFEHSHGPFGENLSAGTHPFSIAAAIKLWTDEESSYNPNNPQFSHYTQVVWKGSKQVGCAVTTCPTLVDAFDNGDFYVCEYYPPGNVIGQFPENVEA